MADQKVKLIEKILNNKKMFWRTIWILLIVGAVTCYGFYTGAIVRIITAIFN